MTPAEKLASEQLHRDLEEAVMQGEADTDNEPAPAGVTEEEAA